jgi:hypothetical protein
VAFAHVLHQHLQRSAQRALRLARMTDARTHARLQIWQWVRHGLKTEEGTVITMELVMGMLVEAAKDLLQDSLAAGTPPALAKVSREHAPRLTCVHDVWPSCTCSPPSAWALVHLDRQLRSSGSRWCS